ncbi:hemolysin family protein [Acholeplasma sp. OttesenSCG-928-E16]|nr:hemolysin family protein [Acholeplasma sp. OttesenSCG-928-E16]
MIGQILALIGLVLLSAFFSSTETAFSSMNKIRMKNMASIGKKGAKLALKISDDFDKLLTTLLIGNNIVNIAATTISTLLFLDMNPTYGATISTVVMTLVILIFGEILPKSLAKEVPERFAILVAPIFQVLIWLFTPFSFLFGLMKKGLSKLFNFKSDQTITEDELLTLVDEAEEDGGINENEGTLIRNVIEFDDEIIENILTPRVKIIAVDFDNDNDEDIKEKFRKSGYSRLPIFQGTIDNIIGVLNFKDFYNYVLLGTEKVADMMSKPVFVTEFMKITDLLTLLRQNKAHVAIVKDEFGGTVGLVTMEDILEEIVGDIWDEHDEIIQQITKIDDNTYKVKGLADFDDILELFDINEEIDSYTINGWIQEELGIIPKKGAIIEKFGLKLVVEEASDTAVKEVLVTYTNKSDEKSE